MTNPLPADVRFIDATRARCDRCGSVMTCSQPWQLMDLCRRHAAESHPQTVSPNPPSG